MIDIRDLREDPDKYKDGAKAKGIDVDIDALLEVDSELRRTTAMREAHVARHKAISQIYGRDLGRLKKAQQQSGPDAVIPIPDDVRNELGKSLHRFDPDPRKKIEQAKDLETLVDTIKDQLDSLKHDLRDPDGASLIVADVKAKRDELLLQVPQPPDPDVPVGASADDNVELSQWNPPWYDTAKSFAENKGFEPKSHIELGRDLGLIDFERGVKMAGTRSYVLTGDGMRLHQAILRYAFDYMTTENGFTPVSVPTLVRDQMLVGTGFFPHGRDQVYAIANPTGEGYGLCMTGTAEVGLMGHHADEILDHEQLPLTYTSVSTCYRREAGAAGKDTAGLFRIHQFDKVEQVVICRADEAESRRWHQKMIGFVETLLQRLELPYRLLQCCTADLGPKNVDQIDLECWMPSRDAYGETHSASRLYDYQCRRLNIRYRDPNTRKRNVPRGPTFCHALNNTVAASPRILIPIIEMYQNPDGTITIPEILRPHMNNQETIG